MTTRRNVILGAGAAALLAGCRQGTGQMLRAADAHPDGYPTVEAVRHFGRLLETRSGGALSLTQYPGGQLGSEKDTLEITIFGGLDFNRVNMAPLNSIVPETFIPSLPFIFRSESHMRAAMDGAPGDAILQALESEGLVGLCFYDSGGRNIYTTKRLVMEPADMKGLKIRVQNSDLYVSLVEALGGDATPMEFAEVYQGLLQGVVDGAENNWPSYESSRHFEAAPFFSVTQHVMAPEVLVMSKRRFDKLGRDHQELVRQCARESVPVMRELWDQRVAASRKIILDAGVTVGEPDLAPFRDKVQPVWARFLTNPRLRRLAEDIQNFGAEG
jgi:tripartite ATP-independent transporter DctP family solute receptor